MLAVARPAKITAGLGAGGRVCRVVGPGGGLGDRPGARLATFWLSIGWLRRQHRVEGAIALVRGRLDRIVDPHHWMSVAANAVRLWLMFPAVPGRRGRQASALMTALSLPRARHQMPKPGRAFAQIRYGVARRLAGIQRRR